LKFNTYENLQDRVKNNIIDELMSSYILIYTKCDENCLKIKDIYKYQEIKDKIEWKIINFKKVPYLENREIKAIQFYKGDFENIQLCLS
jgi:hypothetical protein